MKQYEAVIQALEKLGGVATLGQLNQETMKIKGCEWKTRTPFASIRRVVQLDKNIYKIKPGLYGLLKYKKEIEARGIIAETSANKNSSQAVEFNHSYYQGLLLTIGNLKGLKTFVPNQDKNKNFIDRSLGELRTLSSIPNFSYKNLVQRSSTIDVLWFNERLMPFSFFEVEHQPDFQNSLLKYNDLQDFHTKMVIVSDTRHRSEFEKKVRYSSFKQIADRIKFLDYESLNKQYEFVIEQQSFQTLIV